MTSVPDCVRERAAGFPRRISPPAPAARRLGVAAIVGLALALAGCGPGSDTGTGTGTGTIGAAADFTPTSFANITWERLLAADSEPGEWMTSGRDFGKTHHSQLDQIDVDNVHRLGFAWEYHTDTQRGLQATPIVVDGVMYTSGSTGRAYALNAVTGEEIWAFDPQNDGQVNRYACCDEVNRGVAVWDGMVYVASLDGRLFGLDARTGAVVWEVDTFIYKDRAYTSTGAPEVAGNVVVIGNGGADYDARGYISA
jgi:quinohemoprotein ethanol dehydrogenase